MYITSHRIAFFHGNAELLLSWENNRALPNRRKIELLKKIISERKKLHLLFASTTISFTFLLQKTISVLNSSTIYEEWKSIVISAAMTIGSFMFFSRSIKKSIRFTNSLVINPVHHTSLQKIKEIVFFAVIPRLAALNAAIESARGFVIDENLLQELWEIRNHFLFSSMVSFGLMWLSTTNTLEGKLSFGVYEVFLLFTLYVSAKRLKDLFLQAELVHSHLDRQVIAFVDANEKITIFQLFILTFVPGIAEKIMHDIRNLYPGSDDRELRTENPFFARVESLKNARNSFLMPAVLGALLFRSIWRTGYFELYLYAFIPFSLWLYLLYIFPLERLCAEASELYNAIEWDGMRP